MLTAALLCSAASLLCWSPAPGGARLAADRGLDRRDAVRRLPVDRLTALAAALVAVVAGVGSTPLVAALAAGGVLAGGRAWARRRQREVDARRVHGLAQALGGFAADLRAGRAADEAALAASSACPDEATGEALVRALRAPGTVRASPPGSGAWGAAVVQIAAGVRLSARTGCSLAAVACAVEDDLRGRLRRQQDLRTAIAAPRASAVLLAGLPLLALAMGAGVGADPWGVLTATPVGNLLLVLGTLLEATGLAWSSRLVRRVLP